MAQKWVKNVRVQRINIVISADAHFTGLHLGDKRRSDTP
jgi:hypothetical protein